MALDEQLLGRGKEKADNSESNAPDYSYNEEDSADRSGSLRAAVQAAKNGAPQGSQGDLRADRVEASRTQKLKAKANKAVEAALAPMRKGLNNLLKSAWENLIESFGLTLLWIDIHVFLNMVLGDKLFCNLGEEWIPDKPGIPGAGKK
jgi:hypothetical protein